MLGQGLAVTNRHSIEYSAALVFCYLSRTGTEDSFVKRSQKTAGVKQQIMIVQYLYCCRAEETTKVSLRRMETPLPDQPGPQMQQGA